MLKYINQRSTATLMGNKVMNPQNRINKTKKTLGVLNSLNTCDSVMYVWFVTIKQYMDL